jgi:hypothetical protein
MIFALFLVAGLIYQASTSVTDSVELLPTDITKYFQGLSIITMAMSSQTSVIATMREMKSQTATSYAAVSLWTHVGVLLILGSIAYVVPLHDMQTTRCTLLSFSNNIATNTARMQSMSLPLIPAVALRCKQRGWLLLPGCRHARKHLEEHHRR